MKFKSTTGPNVPFEDDDDTSFFFLPSAPNAGLPTPSPEDTTSSANDTVQISQAPTLVSEAVESSSAQSGAITVTSMTSGGITINLLFDAAAMAAPASFRAGIQQAASLLTAAISDQITVNIKIDYSGTGGGAAAGPDNGLYQSYSSVRAALINHATPGDAVFNALLAGSSIQGQSSVAVWNAQLKLFGLLGANDTTTDDGSATFATDINSNLLVGVALHELTHAMGRVPYGSSPDIFDLFRFANAGSRVFNGASTSPAAYFSIDGGVTKLADYGQNSDPSDFLNRGMQGANDPFNEYYGGGTLQSLTAADKQQLDALGFHTSVALNSIVVDGNTAKAVQGGSRLALLTAAPAITDTGKTNLTSATITIANSVGSAVAGDLLYVNGVQNGAVGSGITANWNASTGTLTLTGSSVIAAYSALLGQVSYADTGTDASSGSHPTRTVTWGVNDGSGSLNTTSVVTIDRAPVANNDTAWAGDGQTVTTTAATGLLSNDTDLDRDTLSFVGLSGSNGAGSLGIPLAGVYGHLTLNADGSYLYVADNLSTINAAPAGVRRTDRFTYSTTDGNGGSATATLVVTIDHTALATASNFTASHNQNIAATSLFSTRDVDGDAITKYQFWDSTNDPLSGHFMVGDVAQGANQNIDVTAAQLSSTTFQSGSGSDDLWVRAFDGMFWGVWTEFHVIAPADHTPVAAASDLTAMHSQNLAVTRLFSASDPDGDTITKYQFWDSTVDATSGHFAVGGIAQGTNQNIDVTAAQLAGTTFQSGLISDDLWVRAFDGTQWGTWQEFHVNVPANHTAVATASDFAATHNQKIAASNLFSASDTDGDAITKYQFWDSTDDALSGHFVVGGIAQGTNQNIDVTAAQLASITFQSGSGSDDLWVRAFDGAAWGGWAEFHVNAPVNVVPVAAASDVTTMHYQNLAVTSLFNVSDANGDTITKYQFWDSTDDTASGHLMVGGIAQGVNQNIDVTAAQLSSTTFQSGSASDDLWVRAFDGTQWGNWKEFHVNVPANHAPVATASDVMASSHNQNIAASGQFSVSDADGDAIAKYQFWDSTTDPSSGHFVVGGIAQGTNQNIDVTAAQLASTTFQSASVTDDLWVRAFDGTDWSTWREFHVSDWHI